MKTVLTLAFLMVFSVVLSAQDITLPTPQKSGGKPIFDAISDRQSTRTLSEEPVSLQDLSDILWSAYGFNRDGMRVVPSPKNQQELFVYVFLNDAAYLYDAKENKLILKAKGDHRKSAGAQDFVFAAPVNLVYIADRSKDTGTGAHISVGCAAQDVYLVCASKGLGCTVRTSGLDITVLTPLLKLPFKAEPLAAQTIGHKK